MEKFIFIFFFFRPNCAIFFSHLQGRQEMVTFGSDFPFLDSNLLSFAMLINFIFIGKIFYLRFVFFKIKKILSEKKFLAWMSFPCYAVWRFKNDFYELFVKKWKCKYNWNTECSALEAMLSNFTHVYIFCLVNQVKLYLRNQIFWVD